MNIDELVDQYNNFVEACNQHHAVDDVMAAKKILSQIYRYAKRLEAEINVMKRCTSCVYFSRVSTPFCKACAKKGEGLFIDWEFNFELLKEEKGVK